VLPFVKAARLLSRPRDRSARSSALDPGSSDASGDADSAQTSIVSRNLLAAIPMKILIVSNLYPPNHHGGYELRCAQVAP
jgi:hypothetical protein